MAAIYGPFSPSGGADDAAVGSIAWSGPGNVVASEQTRALADLSGTTVTHYLSIAFDLSSLVDGETVTKVDFGLEKSRTSGTAGEAVDSIVKVAPGGVAGAVNKADTGTPWGTVDATVVYSWTEAQCASEGVTVATLKDAAFRMKVAAAGSVGGTDRRARIDYATLTVTTTGVSSTLFPPFAQPQRRRSPLVRM